ncbi:MAG: hypothetical protein AB4040_01615 [Synechococcus sp.]
MDKARLQAYAKLIRELLYCPSGEEWIRLRQQEHLLDLTFVHVMEQVAKQLVVKGHRPEARFLHNLAGQLYHTLNQAAVQSEPETSPKVQSHLAVIEQMFAAPDRAQEILASHSELVGPELVQIVKQMAKKSLAEGDTETAKLMEKLADEAIGTWLRHHAIHPNLWVQGDRQDPPEASKLSSDRPDDSLPPQVQKQSATEPSSIAEPSSSAEPSSKSDLLSTSNLHLAAAGEPLVQCLERIATALEQLQLHRGDRPPNPVWYMEVLERASQSDWVLSTEEVEGLIGVKPRCSGNQTTFERGGWLFNKVGKIGSQTSWRVSKLPSP